MTTAAYYAANKAKVDAYTRAYASANRDKINAQARARRAANRDSINERVRERRSVNRDKINEQKRAWYANPVNSGKLRAANRAAHAANRGRNNEGRRLRNMSTTHGLTPEGWAQLWKEQNGLCYACERPLPRKIDVDHFHAHCGPQRSCRICRRGLACHACNVVIGFALDDPDILETIARNLRAANAAVEARLCDEPQQLTLDVG